MHESSTDRAPLTPQLECLRRPEEEEQKSSSVRLAILAVVSRVRCAALPWFGVVKQSLLKEEERKQSRVAEEISIEPADLQFSMAAFKRRLTIPIALSWVTSRECVEDRRFSTAIR